MSRGRICLVLFKLLPRSLFARLALLVVGAFILLHYVTYAAIYQVVERQALQNMLASHSLSLAVSLRLLESRDVAGRLYSQRHFNAMPDVNLEFSVQKPDLVQGEDTYSLFFLGHLQKAWGERPGLLLLTNVHVQRKDAEEISPVQRFLTFFSAPQDIEVHVVTQLRDGVWLSVSYSSQTHPAPPSFTLQVLTLQSLFLVLLVLVMIRWVIRPLHDLADKATRFGHTLAGDEPMVEKGPREVRLAARAFNSMQKRIVRNLEERGQIFAALSHDLRTPLTRIRLRLESMTQSELRLKLLEDVQGLTSIVENSTELMRVPHSIELVDSAVLVDMAAFLDAMVDDRQDMGQDVRVEQSVALSMNTHPVPLRRCLDNIVDNALRYGRSAIISMTRNMDEEGKAVLRIDVDDAGPGLPEENLEKVFEPFFRMESSRNRHTGGNGLGLAIARSMIERMGGRVHLCNRAQGGLKARVELPL